MADEDPEQGIYPHEPDIVRPKAHDRRHVGRKQPEPDVRTILIQAAGWAALVLLAAFIAIWTLNLLVDALPGV